MIPINSPLVRENKPDSLALNPYFLFLCFNARSSSSGVANVAFPLSHSPLGSPLMPDGTTRTFELFRRRLTLPVLLLVTTKILLSSLSVIAQPINYYPLIYLSAVGLALRGSSIITDINYVWFRNVGVYIYP